MMPLPIAVRAVWPTIETWPFAVRGFVNPEGDSRAAGMTYDMRDRVLHVITGPNT